jgi:phospholipase/carboxylesterase
MHISRREFGVLTGGTFVSVAFGAACRAEDQGAGGEDGRLAIRPRADSKTSATGEHLLGLETDRDAILHMPPKPAPGPLPLLVLLHGAGGRGDRMLQRLGTAPDDAGVAVLAPDSRGSTWDAIRTNFGPDVRFLDKALDKVFQMVAVDPARVAVGGFSDGATYALSLGLINGDLFRRVIAFSPGFLVPGTAHGQPRFFVSHGRNDDILPINQCSRRLVPELQKSGHDVTYREFDGTHEVPPAIATEAMAWLAKKD